MNLDLKPEEQAFAQTVREWIAENYDNDMRERMALSKNGYLDKAGQVEWQKRLNAAGWAAPNWPKEYGGGGFSPAMKYVLQTELSAAGCPKPSPMGLAMAAPVIMAFGTDEQKAQHLPSILNSDIWWCQGYSEPGSGSDLASLSMSAVRDGDDYVLNGSKIWTTQAQWADWMFCLVRTDNSGKKQEGISFILFPMDLPGISIRPLPTIDGPAEGEQEINQVFFDNVRAPVSGLIGEENKGWTYAKYLLEFERGNPAGPGLRRQLAKIRHIAKMEESGFGGPLIEDPEFQRRLIALELQVESLSAVEMRVFSSISAGEPVGAISSMIKCAGTEAQQALTELAMFAVGHSAHPFVRDSWAHLAADRNDSLVTPDYAVTATASYLNHRKASIYAGSNEIQRNIMAKAVLGL